jgi:beta-N-acetylhexosaminidase
VPGAFILGVSGPDLTEREAAFLRDADPWGFILFSRNVDHGPGGRERLRRLTDELRSTVGRDAPVLVDQEGGRVQRLRPPHWTAWPSPLRQAEAASDPDRAMWLRGRIIAQELRQVGIDVNCVPCADVAGPGTHPFLFDRCLARDPDAAAKRAKAMADGTLAGGVLPVVKHMPGHGRGTADSHEALPHVNVSFEVLNSTDFVPFRVLADLPLGMTAHVTYGAIDPTRPGTISEAVLRIVRESIGFSGLLMTDDISMGALPGSLAFRSRASLAAGCDVVLHCNGELAEMETVATEAGLLQAEAEGRAAAALALRGLGEPLDMSEARAELAALCAPAAATAEVSRAGRIATR